MRGKNWTPQEYEYLQENWGRTSLPSIAASLNRSTNAIKIKVARLGLGAFLDNGDYVTFNQLLHALGVQCGYGYKPTSWIKNRGFPVKYKTVENNRFRIVYIADFWKWAEQHRTFIDWAKFKTNSIGAEPDWVKAQRKIGVIAKSKYRTTPWTVAEDNLLKMLLKQHRYGGKELSERLMRTEGAIQRRICTLGLMERPVKADNHNKWSDDEYQRLGELIKQGYSYELLSEIFGRSSKAIRGRVYWMYLTEDLDKVRGIIGNGRWGDNRPERPIKHNTLNTSEREEVRNLASALAGLLKGIPKSHFDDCDYWQKDMCQHWDGSCTAGETNCDTCTSFARIKEQYCRRCGVTYYERQVSDMCVKCRKARKKQAQRKFAVLSRKGA